MTTAITPPTRWALAGSVLIACNCDWGCPCNFNALPTKGHCEGGWTWRVEHGAVDDVVLDGLSFSIFVKWPGAIHEGNGEGVIFVDERADSRQRDAIGALVSGQFGGPWAILAWTWPTSHGPTPAPYDVTIDGRHAHLKIGDALALDTTAIRNPVTGAEAHPGVVLPEGLIVKTADLCASRVFTLDAAIAFDHSGQYAAVGPFDYSWDANRH
jgi:hypothetical protein